MFIWVLNSRLKSTGILIMEVSVIFKPIVIFVKKPIVDVWHGPKYATDN